MTTKHPGDLKTCCDAPDTDLSSLSAALGGHRLQVSQGPWPVKTARRDPAWGQWLWSLLWDMVAVCSTRGSQGDPWRQGQSPASGRAVFAFGGRRGLPGVPLCPGSPPRLASTPFHGGCLTLSTQGSAVSGKPFRILVSNVYF